MDKSPCYKRILLKLSGEALSGEEEDKKRRKIKNKKLGKALAEALLIKEE